MKKLKFLLMLGLISLFTNCNKENDKFVPIIDYTNIDKYSYTNKCNEDLQIIEYGDNINHKQKFIKEFVIKANQNIEILSEPNDNNNPIPFNYTDTIIFILKDKEYKFTNVYKKNSSLEIFKYDTQTPNKAMGLDFMVEITKEKIEKSHKEYQEQN